MATKTKIEITSFAISTLLGDNANSKSDQEGFLLGEVFTQSGRVITDQDAEVASAIKVIRITSHMHMLKPCEFYRADGLVDVDQLKKFAGPLKCKIVGYFDFKRGIPQEYGTRPTFRMSQLFASLCNLIGPNGPSLDIIAPELTFMALRQNHASQGTINTSYCFYQFNNYRKFEKLVSEIPNLEDTSHRQYIHSPSIPDVEDILKKYLSAPPSIEKLPVVKGHVALMKQVQSIAESVSTYSNLKQQRLQELQRLREVLKKKREELARALEANHVKKEQAMRVEVATNNVSTSLGPSSSTCTSRTAQTKMRFSDVVAEKSPNSNSVRVTLEVVNPENLGNQRNGPTSRINEEPVIMLRDEQTVKDEPEAEDEASLDNEHCRETPPIHQVSPILGARRTARRNKSKHH